MSGFPAVLAAHAARYPRMEARDWAKLAYQSQFGPAHLLDRDPAALQRAEYQSAFVTEGGGTPEMGDLAIGHIDRSFHLLAQLAQSGAKNEQYLRDEAADALFQRLCAGLIVRKAVLHAENASCAVMWNQKTVYYIPANGKKQSSWENILKTRREINRFLWDGIVLGKRR